MSVAARVPLAPPGPPAPEWCPPGFTRDQLITFLATQFGLTPALAELALAFPMQPTCAALAAALTKSEHTVKTQVHQLCNRLGVESHVTARVALVHRTWRMAHAHGHLRSATP